MHGLSSIRRGILIPSCSTTVQGSTMTDVAPLRRFIQAMARLADEDPSETRWLAEGGALLRGLVADDAWLPDAFAGPGPRYRQYLLHCDPLERFSVVSFVWGPGQRTPVHNHTVWGLWACCGARKSRPRCWPAPRCGRPSRSAQARRCPRCRGQHLRHPLEQRPIAWNRCAVPSIGHKLL
jgi:predicted metal-dependent enzyme (double-stranded beta helix superfamily)